MVSDSPNIFTEARKARNKAIMITHQLVVMIHSGPRKILFTEELR